MIGDARRVNPERSQLVAPRHSGALVLEGADGLVDCHRRVPGRTTQPARGRIGISVPRRVGKSLSVVPRSTPSRSRRACALARGRRLARSRLRGSRVYPRPMRSGVGAAIDSWLERLIVTWVRRQRPVLRLVPARWIRPVTRPTVVRLRRSLSRGALASAVLVGAILTLLILMP